VRKYRGILAALGMCGASVAAFVVLATPASGEGDVGAAADCRWVARESIKIRTAPRTSATSVGLALKGSHVCVQTGVDGGSYTACGQSNDNWAKLGSSRYVAATCLRLER
jgi:hypothetical protein